MNTLCQKHALENYVIYTIHFINRYNDNYNNNQLVTFYNSSHELNNTCKLICCD